MSELSKGIPEADYYEIPETGFDIFSWSPEPPGTLNAKPTQVHVMWSLAGMRLVMRFKSPRTLDRLIDALVLHRKDVWGKK